MKQVTFQTAAVAVQKLDEENKAIVITEMLGPNVPGDTYIVPLPNESAEHIGRELSAPSVAIASVTDIKALKS